MLFLVQGSIFIKVPIPHLPSVTVLVELILRASRHAVYVSGTQVIIVNGPESQFPITVLLIWLELRPSVQSLEDFNHIVSNQRYFGNKRVGE